MRAHQGAWAGPGAGAGRGASVPPTVPAPGVCVPYVRLASMCRRRARFKSQCIPQLGEARREHRLHGCAQGPGYMGVVDE